MNSPPTAAVPKWAGVSLTYEGFPLFLRYPVGLDFDALQNRFPVRAALTHLFSFRRFDGTPESAYNRMLEDFDVWVTGQFDSTPEGQVVLVETFGGKRIYYFYVANSAHAETFLQDVRRQFPGYRLELQFQDDPTWRFIRWYHAEYIDGA